MSGAPDRIPETLRQVFTGPQRPRIIALANQKGGVGKTTTAINLGTALAATERRVLIVDMDPQGNASTGLGIDRKDRRVTTYELIMDGASVSDAALQTRVPGLSIVPSSVSLSGAEVELVAVGGREGRLKSALQMLRRAGAPGTQGADDAPFDYVLVDCPPSLTLLTVNALVAADAVLVPLQCEFFALEGLGHLMTTVERVRRAHNPGLEIQGVVLTMYDKRNSLSDMVAADVRGHFGAKVYDTVIPRNVRVSEAPSHGVPAILYDHRCAGSQAYVHLAGEVLRREAARLAAAAA
ncbi:MAG: ParA family protein [Alphaproteobacteria bacterium]|nr:ParA family protein [Alphaproteobacteria bacterium]